MTSREVRQNPRAKSAIFYGYIVVGTALCIMVAVFGTRYAFGVFFKPMQTHFGWTGATTSGAFSLSMALEGLLGIVMGGLTDRFGPRLVMTLCGFLLGVGYLLMWQISAVWQLYLFYGVIIGIGMGGTIIPLLSTVVRWFTDRRSTMSGIFLTGTGIGMLIGPPVANWLIFTYDWRMSYVILGSIVLVVVIVAAQFLRRDPSQMGLAPYVEKGRKVQELELWVDEFSLREAIYTRQFWVLFAMYFSFGFCFYAVVVHIVPHVTELGISAATAANILATIGGLSIIGKVVLGNVADRIGNRQVFIIGFVLMSAALFWLAPAKEVWMLYLFAAIFGLAYGACASSESPLVARLFGLSSHGLILGIMGLGFTGGAAVSPFLTGYIFDVNGSYQVAFFVLGAVGIFGLIFTILLTPTRAEWGKV